MTKHLTLLLFIFFSCSKDGINNNIDSDKSIEPFHGTYLLKDMDCGGVDLQYLTIDINGISFFDYLGDECDDTVSCYQTESFELMDSSIDTILEFDNENNEIINGILHIVSDTSILITYEETNGSVEFNWEKISDTVSTFIPLCDQQYEDTKDLADVVIYAVSDEGDLLWKTYLHEGIWDLGTSITSLSDGGYIVYGLFDAFEYGGCCYNQNAGTRDLIKLNDQGQEQWRKQINFEDNSTLGWPPGTEIGRSIIQTSLGDLAVIAPGLDNIINILLMETDGTVIWSKNLSGLSSWSGYNEILETEDGNLAVIGGFYGAFSLLDYNTGSIIEQKEYDGIRRAKNIINVDDDFAILGELSDPESLSNRPLYLQKISSEGDEIWRKTWEDDSTKPRKPQDLILTADNGYLLFCFTGDNPFWYATLIKTDSEGNEQWRRQYFDSVGKNGRIHKTEDGGYFMSSAFALTKLDENGDIEWDSTADCCISCFEKNFNNDSVTAINFDMRKIDGGAIITGYGSIE